MLRVSKPLAALVLGLAVSALATPSFAQRSEGMSSAGAGAARLQRQGWKIYRTCLGRQRDLHLPLLHGGTRAAGIAPRLYAGDNIIEHVAGIDDLPRGT
jgi:hypothetical protein